MAETDPVFILGCERSGSTWLANIFDAHADVELWMEPFAEYAELFPGFPDRNEYVTGAREDLVENIRHGWKKLARHKYPLLYRPGLAVHRRGIDRRLVSLYWKARKAFGLKATAGIDRYVLLNLNSSAVPCSQQTRKTRSPRRQVVKELRLNFKIALLAKVFPAARYVVTIRHPGAQIGSILRLWSRGNLKELSDSMSDFAGTVASHPRFERYRDALATRSEGMAATLIAWWFVNYEVLLEDLEQNELPYHLVPHEEISADPGDMTRRLLSACGLEVDSGVRDFLCYSTRGGGTHSPLDTVRDSSAHFARAIDEADPSIIAIVRALADRQKDAGRLHPRLDDYLAGLSERTPSPRMR